MIRFVTFIVLGEISPISLFPLQIRILWLGFYENSQSPYQIWTDDLRILMQNKKLNTNTDVQNCLKKFIGKNKIDMYESTPRVA